MNSIEIKGLSKKYPTFSLSNIDFNVPQGTIVGLVGANGAGKSTTIHAILNLIGLDGGQVSVLGTDTQSKAFQQTKQDLGIVIDEAYFPEILTPHQVEQILKRTYKNFDSAYFQSLLSRFDLPPKSPLKTFSRGMKMKLSLMVALSHHPKLLILDEATSGLDPLVRDEILSLLADFTRDETHSILISSHIVSDLEKLCDYIAFLHQGKLMLFAEKDEILEEYAIVHLPKSKVEELDPSAIVTMEDNGYGVELLVRRKAIPNGTPCQVATLEEIIILLSKEWKK